MSVLNKKTIEDLSLKGRKVLVRCDFNVKMDGGKIVDDKRIVAALPTIKYLLAGGAKVVLCSHLGRPKGAPDPAFTMAPVAERLSEYLEIPVALAADVVGPDAQAKAAALGEGQAMLLENTRFEAGETKNDEELSKKFAALVDGDIFVNDAFGTAHRANSSTAGVAAFVKESAIGYLMQKEVYTMGAALEEPKRPFVAILGGAKVSDKIGVIENLIDKCDTLIIGGGMAYTFMKSMGNCIGTSLCEEDKLDLAKDLMKKAHDKGVCFLIPVDNIIAREYKEDAIHMRIYSDSIPDGWMGLDIGKTTQELFSKSIAGAGTVIWNGPMGVSEWENFAGGTIAVANAVADATDAGATSIIGGGDSAAAIKKLGFANRVTHVSTGGGASLEFLEGKPLPGIACISDK